MLQSDIPGVLASSTVRKRSFSGNPSVGIRDNSASVKHTYATNVPHEIIGSSERNSLDSHHFSQEDISLKSDSGCPSTETSAGSSGPSATSSSSSAGNKSRKSSGSSSSGCSMKMVSEKTTPTSSVTSSNPGFSVPSKLRNFIMDNFTPHRQRTKSLATPPSSKHQYDVISKSDEVFLTALHSTTPPSSRPCSHPPQTGCTRKHHHSGGNGSDRQQRTGCHKPCCSTLPPLSITTNNASTSSKGSSSGRYSPSNAPMSPTGLEPILQGQELSTTPPQRFHYNAATSSTPRGSERTRSNSGNASPGYHTSSPSTAPPPKIKKRSKSPLSGRIITRLRSLSMSEDVSGSSDSPPGFIDPAKLPKQEAKSCMSFAPQGLKYSRLKKIPSVVKEEAASELSQQMMGHSDGDADLLRHERPKSVHSVGENADDRFVAGVSIDSSTFRCNRLERALSLHPDRNSDQGTAMTAMSFGVKRVSENKRFIMLSKSSLRTPDDFGGLGTEYLGDNFAYATFFHHSTCYDLLPDSAKLIVLDSKLQVGKAFRALHVNGIRAAPLWSSRYQKFVGLLTVTDFIRVLKIYYQNPNLNLDDLEQQSIEDWRELLQTSDKPLQSINPEDSLFTALTTIAHPDSARRLPIIDLRSGNILYLLSSRRMLQYLHLKQGELPIPSFINKTLEDIKNSGVEELGTFGEAIVPDLHSNENSTLLSDNDNEDEDDEEDSFKSFPSDDEMKKELICVRLSTKVIEALTLLDKYRMSALPVLNEEKQLVNVYAKFEVMTMASLGTYKNLDITVEEALKDSKKFEINDCTCLLTASVNSLLNKLFTNNKRRLFVIDNLESRHLIGCITVTDLLRYIVLQHVPPPHSLHPISEHAANSQVRRSISLDHSSVSPRFSGELNLRHSRSVNIHSTEDSTITATTDCAENTSLMLNHTTTEEEISSTQDEDLFKMDIV